MTRSLIAWALFACVVSTSAQQDPPGRMDELQKAAGTTMAFRVLRMTTAAQFPESAEFVAPESAAAIVEAGGTRAIVIPRQTIIQTGQETRLNVQLLARIAAPPRSGLPNPVAVYLETSHRDQILFRVARVEEIFKILDGYKSSSHLQHYFIPPDRVSEITPQFFSRGLKNPLSEDLAHFFTKAESERYRVVGVVRNGPNFEVRMVHADSGTPAALILSPISRSSLRGAQPGSIIQTGEFIRTLDVTSSRVSVGAMYQSEIDFIEVLISIVAGW